MDTELIYLEHDYEVNNNLECSPSLIEFQKNPPGHNIINLPSTSSYSSPILFDRIRREDDSEKVSWLEPATKLLIALVQEMQPKVGKTLQLKTKKKMWEHVKLKMQEHGYVYSSLQIENKFKSLERSFKNKLQHNKKTGRDRASCKFEKELNDMYKGRDKIFPQCTLEVSGDGTTQKQLEEQAGIEETIQNNIENAVEEVVTSPEPKKRKEKSSSMKELILEKKEYNKKKLEAYERRTAEVARKNDLLEELIKTMKKKD